LNFPRPEATYQSGLEDHNLREEEEEAHLLRLISTGEKIKKDVVKLEKTKRL
tara:strand:+ start:364 stop:519 length:156 start_codon:yes stop_codon:yes gene_type:complete